MRIAILADPLDNQSAGIYVYTREIIRAMTKLDSPHEFIIIRAKEGTEDFGAAEQIIVPIQSFPPFHLRIRQLFTIPKILIQKKVDVVIEPAHFGPFNLPKHIKRVTVIHDLTPLLFPQFHPFMSVLFHKRFLKGALQKTDLILTNSAHTAKDVIQQFPFAKNKTKAILLGKDDAFQPTENPTVLEKYKISQPYILYMGTLEPRKNLSVLLAAFEQWKQASKRPHQLVLAGKKGWQIEDLYTAIEQSSFRKDIILTGFVDAADMATLYSMAAVFVYPSFYEGFGLPILEAMACGTPVIASDTSSMPEVGGNITHYFEPNNKERLANLLEEVLDTPVDKAALAKWSQQFSWKRAGQETVKALESESRQE